jgi:hypothetical protein
MKLKDKCKKYTTPQLRKVGLKILSLVRKKLGHGNKPVPKFKINNRLNGYYGQYDYEYVITINPSNCETIEMFVRTIIHEYTHHIQKGLKRNYTSSVKRDGYYNSPFEVEARGNEKKYKSVIWKEFKQSGS